MPLIGDGPLKRHACIADRRGRREDLTGNQVRRWLGPYIETIGDQRVVVFGLVLIDLVGGIGYHEQEKLAAPADRQRHIFGALVFSSLNDVLVVGETPNQKVVRVTQNGVRRKVHAVDPGCGRRVGGSLVRNGPAHLDRGRIAHNQLAGTDDLCDRQIGCRCQLDAESTCQHIVVLTSKFGDGVCGVRVQQQKVVTRNAVGQLNAERL